MAYARRLLLWGNFVPSQSRRKVTQEDYDADLFDWLSRRSIGTTNRVTPRANRWLFVQTISFRHITTHDCFSRTFITKAIWVSCESLTQSRKVGARTNLLFRRPKSRRLFNREVYEKVAAIATYQRQTGFGRASLDYATSKIMPRD